MTTWRPQPGPQEKAIRANFVDEIFYGGGRGGGKSWTLCYSFLAGVEQYGEHWKGVLIRRTYPELDEIIDQTRQMYKTVYPEADYKVGRHEWVFPNGATLKLRHLENEADADHFQGQQYTWVVARRRSNGDGQRPKLDRMGRVNELDGHESLPQAEGVLADGCGRGAG